MTAVASVRIKTDEGRAPVPPDRARANRVADLLRARGFQVQRIGRFSISVAADEAVFARELGVNIRRGFSMCATPATRDRQLGELIDLVEVAGSPTSF